MFAIDGQICSNLGVASDCVRRQFPQLVAQYPAIAKCHHGTINVRSAVEAQIRPEFRTSPFRWNEDGLQTFGFLSIRFEVLRTGLTADAWIYMPSHTVHRSNRRLVEVLAEKLDVEVGDACRLHIPCQNVKVLK